MTASTPSLCVCGLLLGSDGSVKERNGDVLEGFVYEDYFESLSDGFMEERIGV
jgi:hypothetical protein